VWYAVRVIEDVVYPFPQMYCWSSSVVVSMLMVTALMDAKKELGRVTVHVPELLGLRLV